MGKRPVRSPAVHWLRWIVRDLHGRGESKGNEARRVLVRSEGEVKGGCSWQDRAEKSRGGGLPRGSDST
jgi:hypothetical protein